MADIEVVIKLDEDRYKSICDGVEAGKRVNVPSLYAHKIIANGIPLPKGHGRLIDADKLQSVTTYFGVSDAPVDVVRLSAIRNARTVIEADRA